MSKQLVNPHTFDGIVGNVAVKRVLLSLIRMKGPPPVVILHGPSGAGKTQLAKAFATQWAAVHSSDTFARTAYELVACARDADLALRAADSWIAGGWSLVDNPALILNEVDRLLGRQVALLDLLEGGRGELPAPVIMTTVEDPGASRLNNSKVPIFDAQFLRRCSVSPLPVGPVADNELRPHLEAVAAAWHAAVSDEVLDRVLAAAMGLVGVAIPLLRREIASM